MKAARVIKECPAKINLSLHVLGRRSDGFHSLHSVVAQTAWADVLELDWDPDAAGRDRVEVEGLAISGRSNSVERAIALVRESAGVEHGVVSAHLRKRIPIGAGLGGGSSDAVGALRALRDIWPEATRSLDWSSLALKLGSDCPLFLAGGPVLMEGQGERVEALNESLAGRLAGRPVLLFKPPFSVETPEAYRRLAEKHLYSDETLAKGNLLNWETSGASLPELHNDFMRLMEHWMPSLAVVLNHLRREFGLDAQLSGSGSACFAFSGNDTFDIGGIGTVLRSAWGSDVWIDQTRLK